MAWLLLGREGGSVRCQEVYLPLDGWTRLTSSDLYYKSKTIVIYDISVIIFMLQILVSQITSLFISLKNGAMMLALYIQLGRSFIIVNSATLAAQLR